jgi:uncharacterized protein involved in type VI secretion and phage assembly
VNDETLARFIERGEGKYWGKYRGFVEDRNDPSKLGRLRVRVPSIMCDALTDWAWPASSYAGANLGFFFIPQHGDLVWVEFVEGALSHPLWSGCAWAEPEGVPEIPEEAKASYPDTQVLKTRSGHVIILDDRPGGELITIRAKNGCEITIDPKADQITITAQHVTIQTTGEAAQPLATRDFVEKVFNQHVHPSGVGPTGKPVPIPVPTALTRCLEGE